MCITLLFPTDVNVLHGQQCQGNGKIDSYTLTLIFKKKIYIYSLELECENSHGIVLCAMVSISSFVPKTNISCNPKRTEFSGF